MEPVTVVLVRSYSAILDEGRTATATVQCTRVVGDPDVLTTVVNSQEPSNLTPDELTDWQTFIALLDEEVTLVEALIILDEEPT